MLNNENTVPHILLRIGSLIAVIILSFSLMTMSVSAEEGQLDVDNTQLGTVYVKVDGTTTPIAINGRTQVFELLESLNVTLGENDTISKNPEQYVQKDDEIVVVRRGYSTRVEEGEIPHKVIYTYSADVKPGKETVITEGRDGYGTHVIRQLVENGVVLEETVIESDYSIEPIDREVAVGFKVKPISDFDFDWDFNENHEPMNIINVLRGQRATAYTAGDGALTATGREAMVGHVAVNPKIIPYGSKLFIQSSDGKHIYGYAIAADTGGALLSGAANVDLYFDTMGECRTYGVGTVDIFVLSEV